jgi:Carbohydrate-selective porin, OprB family
LPLLVLKSMRLKYLCSVSLVSVGVSLAIAPLSAQTLTGQMPSVSQLSDVQLSDWSYQALQNLVERYGCIAGYPEGQYWGDRALSRYEFAAGLSACLDRISEQISSSVTNSVTREDLATLQRLQTEFTTELTTLRSRVNTLETSASELETNQFSTTTKLDGNAILTLADSFGDDRKNNETVFQSRIQLNFDTSFTGSDRLRAGLEWGNFASFNTPTASAVTDLGLAFSSVDFYSYSDTENQLALTRLEYFFPVGDRTTVYLEGKGAYISDIVYSASSLDSDLNSFSGFTYNPIYNLSPSQGVGAGVTVQLNDALQLGLGYLSGEGDRAQPGAGLFNGDYAAFGQLTLTTGSLTAAATYVNHYTDIDDPSRQTLTNAYGLSAEYAVNDSLFLGGWASYFDHIFMGEGEGSSWSYAGYAGVRGLGGKGNLLSVIVGVPLRLTASSVVGLSAEDSALHVEGFYKYRLNDSIAIIPGIIWLNDPGNHNSNEDVVIGAIKTTFSF